jgi:hypothetical protein
MYQLTLRKNSENSSFFAFSAEMGRPVSFKVWRRKSLTSFRVARSDVAFLSFEDWPSKVLGSMLGNSFSATGSNNSAKGTMTKGRNGIKRPRS